MRHRFKDWLYIRFLPAWAKDGVYQENKKLCDEIERLERELALREAYIEGLERGIRAVRRVIIHNQTGGTK